MTTMNPCPFCGSDKVIEAKEMQSNEYSTYASCENCGAKGPFSRHDPHEANLAWNKRQKATNDNENIDWESIAKAQSSALLTCMNCLKAKGSGFGFVGWIDKETKQFNSKHWREIVADALEKMPGVKVDRDLCHALDLPKKQRDKFFRERELKEPKQ